VHAGPRRALDADEGRRADGVVQPDGGADEPDVAQPVGDERAQAVLDGLRPFVEERVSSAEVRPTSSQPKNSWSTPPDSTTTCTPAPNSASIRWNRK
jgi:hypothetical protein